jgi:hypothetical protein
MKTLMLNQIFQIKHAILLMLAVLISGSCLFAQEKTNLNIFFELVDKSVEAVLEDTEQLPGYKLRLNLSQPLNVFENRLTIKFTAGSNSTALSSQENTELIYTIEGTSVVYKEPFKKNLFGDFYLEREIKLSGSYLIKDGSTNLKTFMLANTDTIKYSRASEMESSSFPFTKGEIPAEPLFSTIFEPAIIIGAAAVSVYLFFTVRSK